MIISTFFPLEIGWISGNCFQKLICTSHKPFVLLSNGEILSKKRLESPHFLNMIKIKESNFALNFFLILDKWDHMFIHLHWQSWTIEVNGGVNSKYQLVFAIYDENNLIFIDLYSKGYSYNCSIFWNWHNGYLQSEVRNSFALLR